MQSAAAYRQVTPEESMECAKCAREQGRMQSLANEYYLFITEGWCGHAQGPRQLLIVC